LAKDTRHERKGKKKEGLVPLRDVMAAILKDPNLPFNPKDGLIWEVWDDVVGETIAKNARPSWIKDGRLRVDVTNPIWLQELAFVKENIRGRLNERLGREAVKRIEFRLGTN
jgi:predicted nucleic acid-binding Zn ribbon protein